MADVLDVRKLRMLALLDDLGTIAAVAQALQLTAPGISMQLAALEREVGVALTERQGRRVVVTPAGTLLAQHARNIGDLLTVAGMEVDAIRAGAAGTYRLAAFPTAARTLVASAWRTLRDSPALGIELRLNELEPVRAVPALAAGDVDLAVVHRYSTTAPLLAPGLSAQPLGSEDVLLAVPGTGTAHQEPADLAAYSEHDWIVPHREWSCHEMVLRACGRAGFTPRAVAEVTDFSVQLALVAAGAGVALVPRLAATALPAGVRVLELTDPIQRHHFLLTRQSSAADQGLRRIGDLLRAAAQDFLTTPGTLP